MHVWPRACIPFGPKLSVHPENQDKFEGRVIRAAEAALAERPGVSAIDVLSRMGLPAPAHVADWRQGRIDFPERVIQGNLRKNSASMAAFHRWAREKVLRPSETRYIRATCQGPVDLQFSKSGDPEIEKSDRIPVTAAVRHRYTAYDSLLGSGLDRALARDRVAAQVQAILAEWRVANQF